jgi:SNF2 family DNA or RNA helicase
LLKPFKHQADELLNSGDKIFHAIFWDQGTGKTKLMLDNVVHLARKGEIDAVLILAPNGVHRNWIEEEIPKHLGNGLFADFWTSSKAGTQRHQRRFKAALTDKFPIVAMTYEGFMTARGKAWAKKFLTKREVMFILDESTAIKTPGAKRTKTLVAAGKYAKYRRILTGTPATNGPFDVYSPLRFLDNGFWKRHGFPTFTEFKHHFGIWQKGHNSEQGRDYEFVTGYRNLDQLKRMLDPVSSRVTKDEVLDLPPKLYSKRQFELSKEQKRVYEEIRNEALAFLASGDLVTAPLAIVRLLRLQQVTSNYMPVDDDGPLVPIDPKKNPRLDCLGALLEEVNHQAIIWAKFRKDIDQIMDLLGKKAVRYDGATDSDARAAAKAAFQAGEAQYFVGNPAAGGMGLTLTAARTVIYYNNSFRLVDRLQSEDRAHRIGQPHPVDYVDIMATGTVDVRIAASLRAKVDVMSKITGDKLREWI